MGRFRVGWCVPGLADLGGSVRGAVRHSRWRDPAGQPEGVDGTTAVWEDSRRSNWAACGACPSRVSNRGRIDTCRAAQRESSGEALVKSPGEGRTCPGSCPPWSAASRGRRLSSPPEYAATRLAPQGDQEQRLRAKRNRVETYSSSIRRGVTWGTADMVRSPSAVSISV